ncbi:MAG: DUF1559 domain-containing protein [Planctomycetota bacterium]
MIAGRTRFSFGLLIVVFLFLFAIAGGNRSHADEGFDLAVKRVRDLAAAIEYSQEFLRALESENPSSLRGLSWRVHLLPMLGHSELYSRFDLDASWDSPLNKSLLPLMPVDFRTDDDDTPNTRIRFLRRAQNRLPDTVTPDQFRDGNEQTAVLYLDSVAAPWTKPDAVIPQGPDADWDDEQPTVLVTADGSVHPCPEGLHRSKWNALRSANGGEVVSIRRLLSEPDKPLELSNDGAQRRGPESTNVESDKGEVERRLAEIAAALPHLRIPESSGLSWRVHLLPWLGQKDLHDRFHFDEPWDSDHNLRLVAEMPKVYGADPTKGRSPYRGIDRVLRSCVDDWPSPRASSRKLAVIFAGPERAAIWTRPSLLSWRDVIENRSNGVSGAFLNGSLVNVPGNTSASKWTAVLSPEISTGIPEQDWFGELAQLEVPTYRAPKHLPNRIDLPAAPAPVLSVDDNELTYRGRAYYGTAYKVLGAFLAYQEKKRNFPEMRARERQDELKLSWRVQILPMLGYEELYQRFDQTQPWDSDANRKLLKEMPAEFRLAGEPADSTDTRYCMFISPEMAFDGEPSASSPSMRDLSDPWNSIVIGGIVGKDMSVPWTKPQDVDVDIDDLLGSIGDVGEVVTLFGIMKNVFRLPRSTPQPLFRAMLTRHGREWIDAAQVERWAAQMLGEPLCANEKRVPFELKRLFRSTRVVVDRLRRDKIFPEKLRDALTRKSYFRRNLSWRVHVLKYVGFSPLYHSFHLDEPWDSPHNSQLIPLMPDVFRDADDPFDSTTTRMLAFSGNRTVLNPETGYFESARMTDRPEDTLLLFLAPQEQAVVWTKPDDFPFDENDPLVMLAMQNGLHVSFSDKSVNVLTSEIDADSFKALVTGTGGEDAKAKPFLTLPN